jgi:hypothetical protein
MKSAAAANERAAAVKIQRIARGNSGRLRMRGAAISAQPKPDYFRAALDFALMTAKDIVRPVTMPLQLVGRDARALSIDTASKYLPGIVRSYGPMLRAELQEGLHKLHEANADVVVPIPPDDRTPPWLQPLMPTELKLRVCLAEAAREHTTELFEELSLNLRNVSRAVHAMQPADEEETAEGARKAVTRIAFEADLIAGAALTPGASEHEGAVQITIKRLDGFALLKVSPRRVHVDGRVKIWWNTRSGLVRLAFLSEPRVRWEGPVHLLGGARLPPCCSDGAVCSIVQLLLGLADVAHPISVPLAVPTAMAITDAGFDDADSLAALPGLVREGSRVLRNLALDSSLSIDAAVPRAAFRLAKGIVILHAVAPRPTLPGSTHGIVIAAHAAHAAPTLSLVVSRHRTHMRGAIGVGGGVGSGIMLKRLPDGRWVSIATGPRHLAVPMRC